MADEVFKRIVQRVLPETEMHMRALLPDLTDGRYRDVTLLGGDENSADLRIRVWDEQAGRYVGKHLFSGGTRDQCSLALRLAFALATLPKELGAMHGFNFLDEPLSSFDDRRSQALVDVLTRGPIAKQFPQVFLISHSQSFDPAAFTCALRMAGGRIASSTLPDEAAARALWDAG
jgi:DNA repair exonuclease SbcCD ATPase subunit